MASTQVHIIDPCGGGLILVQCEDGSRVLFGSNVQAAGQQEIVQRIFEVLEDGAIDYFIHSGVDVEGKLDYAAIDEFFPVKNFVELVGQDIEYPASYLAFRGSRPVEVLEPDDVLGFGATSVRVFGAPAGRPMAGGIWRPLALHVAHETEEGTNALLALGSTGGLDWLAIEKTLAEEMKADCLVVNGAHPLDIVITTGDRVEVSIDHLRRIGPKTVVMGAEHGSRSPLRSAALELYSCFTRDNGGQPVIDMKKDSWLALKLDGLNVKTESEPRALGQAA
ncbi:hypothetical protein SLNSH_23220 [Alsobacter soli]|uniref:Metallo-beta-lactamase domain-containing protein n=1 Tax=Alsobacter soli TaxID=2109933 RepID=A0A2T1HLQ9_9HYPH|nr:hypothetical protein [Alsobacter soli]PSC02590.1 hypothetical protein SLNSH_23220 [Alsobacter soli]